jgi:hypothetical protein
MLLHAFIEPLSPSSQPFFDCTALSSIVLWTRTTQKDLVWSSRTRAFVTVKLASLRTSKVSGARLDYCRVSTFRFMELHGASMLVTFTVPGGPPS